MARFQFRLESLARLRAAERNERRSDLAEAYRAERLIQQQIDNKAEELARLRTSVREGSTPGDIHVEQLLQGHRFQLVLTVQKRELEQNQQQVRTIIDQRRAALLEADRQVRLLDKLRQRRRDEYDQHQFLAEMKVLDEVAQRTRRGKDPWTS